MRRKVKEKLVPLAVATMRDSIRKVRAVAASGPEDRVENKEMVLLNSHAIIITAHKLLLAVMEIKQIIVGREKTSF